MRRAKKRLTRIHEPIKFSPPRKAVGTHEGEKFSVGAASINSQFTQALEANATRKTALGNSRPPSRPTRRLCNCTATAAGARHGTYELTGMYVAAGRDDVWCWHLA